MIKAVLFDLDGTLLNVDMEDFLRRYLERLSRHFSHLMEPQLFVVNLMTSTQAMIMSNNPSMTNQEVFMDDFFKRIPHPSDVVMPLIEEFYDNIFPELRQYVDPFPETPANVETASELGFRLVLATNPVFPQKAIRQRISWAGLHHDLFELVTSYENMHFAKPNPGYYREIASYLGADPAECLMVGNDADDDIAAAAAVGMKTVLVEDMLVNKSGNKPVADISCTVADLRSVLVKLKQEQEG